MSEPEKIRTNEVMIDYVSALALSAQNTAMHFMASRDEFMSKYLFGLVALNGGSAIALLTLLGGASRQMTSLGLTPEKIVTAALFFGMGVLAAGTAIFFHSVHLSNQVGVSVSRAINLQGALISTKSGNHEDAQVILERLAKGAPETAYSMIGIVAQNTGGGLWVGGAVAVAMALAKNFA